MEPRRIAIVAVSLVAAAAVWLAPAELGLPMELAPVRPIQVGTPKAALKGVRPEGVPERTKVEGESGDPGEGGGGGTGGSGVSPGAVRSRRPPRLRRPQVMTTTMKVETDDRSDD